jgi:hypothetical protein
MWKNMVEPDKPQMAINFACRLSKATNTHSFYYLLNFLGNSGYANASQYYVYTYVACLINRYFHYVVGQHNVVGLATR